MDSSTFFLHMLGSLADIRQAIWMTNASVAAVAVAILLHALLTRRRSA